MTEIAGIHDDADLRIKRSHALQNRNRRVERTVIDENMFPRILRQISHHGRVRGRVKVPRSLLRYKQAVTMEIVFKDWTGRELYFLNENFL